MYCNTHLTSMQWAKKHQYWFCKIHYTKSQLIINYMQLYSLLCADWLCVGWLQLWVMPMPKLLHMEIPCQKVCAVSLRKNFLFANCSNSFDIKPIHSIAVSHTFQCGCNWIMLLPSQWNISEYHSEVHLEIIIILKVWKAKNGRKSPE